MPKLAHPGQISTTFVMLQVTTNEHSDSSEGNYIRGSHDGLFVEAAYLLVVLVRGVKGW